MKLLDSALKESQRHKPPGVGERIPVRRSEVDFAMGFTCELTIYLVT